nr:isoform cytoplasmic+nuclear of cca trna nucleotidyltransferase, mitochondrial [Quercus suber]
MRAEICAEMVSQLAWRSEVRTVAAVEETEYCEKKRAESKELVSESDDKAEDDEVELKVSEAIVRERVEGFGKSQAIIMANTNSASAPVVEEVKERIELTQMERSIFDRLLATLRHFDLTNHHLRVAGGWVRDKLLGKECYDIDIALDNMLGSEFVDKVRDYLLSTGEQVQGVAVIPCNPEQSKHLETARMRLFDMWIDFVNLRSEEYSDNSRIPTKVNDEVDFANLFAIAGALCCAKFGFLLDEELKEAASCDEVKDALAAKISRERIGVEIDLMLSGNQPVKAMTYICDLMLFWIVFTLPPKFEPAKSEGCDRFCIGYLDATWSLIQLIGDSTFNDEQRRLSLYAALFLPFRKTIYKDNKAKKIPVVNYIFRESLKRKASDAETVVNLHSALDKFLSLIPFLVSEGNIQPIEVNWGRGLDDVPYPSKLRVLTGLLLREIKDFWRVTLLLSTLLYPTEVDCTEDFPKQHFQLDKQRDLFEAVESAIAKLGLEKVWDVKPLVNGKDIMSVLQHKAGGPLIRVWQQKLLAWQLAHPYGTAEECTDWMRQSHSKRVKTE